MITSLFDRLLSLFRKKRIEHELDEEIRSHIELATEENLNRGMNPEEARRAALRSFGHVEQMKEVHRDVRGLPLVEAILADLRFAMRGLRRKPGFTATTAATLALGIASCTVVFGVINAVLLRPLPYSNPHQLVYAISTYGGQTSSISPPDFLDLRAQNQSLSEFAAMGSGLDAMTLTGSASPQRVQVESVSGNFFAVFGTKPVLGRTLRREDETTGAPAVISYGLWHNHFGGRQDLIGQPLRLDGRVFTIVGVAPADFRFPNRSDVWIPFPLADSHDRGAHQLLGIGRLRENVSLSASQRDLALVASRLEMAYPATNKGFGVRITPLQQELVGFLQSPLLILLSAVGLLLLLACANVANLLLARGTARTRELATRMALGAGRARLVRLLISESAILASLGGVLGVLLASWVISLIAALPADLSPGGPPIAGLSDAAVDRRVLGFAVLLSMSATVLVSLFPAFRNMRMSVIDAIRSGPATAGRHHRQLASKSLVVFEVAISLTLLIGAGVTFRSFLNVMHVNPGFNPSHMLTLKVKPQIPKQSERNAYFRNLLDEVGRIPGVQSAALVSELPLSGNGQEWYFDIQHRPAPSPTERPIASYRRISSDYFKAMEIPVVRGRGFTNAEIEAKAPVAIIDEQLAQRFFAGEDPLGKRILLAMKTTPYEIVGITGNVLHYALFQEVMLGGAYPTLYTPDLAEVAGPTLVVRTNTSAASAIRSLRDTLQRVDKDLPTADVNLYEDTVSAGLLLPRLGTLLLASFSTIGMVLAVIGLYGVLAFSTARRTTEIGVRMALGSSRSGVLKLILTDGLRLSMWGVLIGLAGAYGFTRLLSGLLIRVKPLDPSTFLIVSLLFISAASVATYIPARRASTIDPALTLRHL